MKEQIVAYVMLNLEEEFEFPDPVTGKKYDEED